MKSKHSSYLSLNNALILLTSKGWGDTDAREFLFEALREGKLGTREWQWDERVKRYVLLTVREAKCDPGEISEWADLLDKDINWEQSLVATLYISDPESSDWIRRLGAAIHRLGVDKLEIHKVDLAKLLSEIEAKHDAEEGIDSAINERPNRRSRGRKPGDGAYDDSQHIQEMERLVRSRKAKSGNEAARQVVQSGAEVQGASSESIMARLAKKFNASQKQ